MRETMISFISLPSRAGSPMLPIAYIYLAAWLEKQGISSEIVDIKNVKRPSGMPIFDSREALARILSAIESKRPKIYWFHLRR